MSVTHVVRFRTWQEDAADAALTQMSVPKVQEASGAKPVSPCCSFPPEKSCRQVEMSKGQRQAVAASSPVALTTPPASPQKGCVKVSFDCANSIPHQLLLTMSQP